MKQYDQPVKLSTAMYAITKLTHPPTGIEHCVRCNFYNCREKNLVVAGATQLKVYRLIADGELQDEEQQQKVKLEHMQSFSLFGNIIAMEVVKLHNARDCLLLGFRDAKMSLVEYDPATHDLRTVALRSFEKEELRGGHTQWGRPLMKVDPNYRCAAMLVYGRAIAVVPFKKEMTQQHVNIDWELEQKESAMAGKASQLDWYPIVFDNMDDNILNVIDMQFLYGYYEPTLLILYEPLRTWTGRLAIRKDTCALMALSLNLQQHVHPTIWSVENLPYNCQRVLPIPKPIGGVLVAAVNALLYLNQSVPPYGVSLNSFTDESTVFPLRAQEGVRIALDCAQYCPMAYDKIVITLKGGEIYVLTMFNDGMRSVTAFHFERAAASVITTCVTLCDDGYIFLGSRIGNSLLLRYSEKLPEDEDENKDGGGIDFEDDEDLYGTAGGGSKEEENKETSIDKKNDDDDQQKEKEKLEGEGESGGVDSLSTSNDAAVADGGVKEGESSLRKKEEETTDADLYGDEPASKKMKVLDDKEEEGGGEKGKEENGEVNKEGSDEEAKTQEDGSAFTTDNLGDWMAKDVALLQDPEELEVYGTEKQRTIKDVMLYRFEVCDSLINIGPCGRASMGEPAFLSEEFENRVDPDVELVTTSGYGKNGALCVLQRTIRPQVITTFELPGCTNLWTVYGPRTPEVPPEIDATKPETDPEAQQQQPLDDPHSYLILSRADNTMILQTADEINELDHSGFNTQSSTVVAGNLGDRKYILQVCTTGVRLLEGIKQIQHIPLDVGSPIVEGCIADPYAVIMSEEGMVIHLSLQDDSANTGKKRLVVLKPQFPGVASRVLCMTVYRDVSGLFTTTTTKLNDDDDLYNDDTTAEGIQKNEIKAEAATSSFLESISSGAIDDEDALLYGDSAIEDTPTIGVALSGGKTDDGPGSAVKDEKPKLSGIHICKKHDPTYWLFLVRENSTLEIYSLPTYKLCYVVRNFGAAYKVLYDTGSSGFSASSAASSLNSDPHANAMVPVREIRVAGLGLHGSRPLLIARIDQDLVVYEAYPYHESSKEGRLKLRFRKVRFNVVSELSANVLLHQKRGGARGMQRGETGGVGGGEDDESGKGHLQWIRPFSDISGYSGVMICGPRPHWLFMTPRGELRAHPMLIDGQVDAFSPFHNVNCPRGFLYFNKQSELRICSLPTHVTYDAPWPVRKVPLRKTVHFVNYHVDSRTYCVVTSVSEVCVNHVRHILEEKEFEFLQRSERHIYPTMEKFSMELFSPVSWDQIPNTKENLEDYEHVTILKNIMLPSEGTQSGMKGYLAVGTNFCYGEDVNSRGRILIMDIIDVVPEPGQPLTRNKIKMIYSKEQKGPVTALCQVSGLLLSAIGQKIFLWQLKDGDLVGIAFIDTQIYIHSCLSLKNIILVSDVFKSITVLRYQEKTRTLSLVSRDICATEVYGTEYFIDGSQMAFVVGDSEANLLLFMYQPESRESYGGSRLLRRGDIHLGSRVNAMFRIRCRLADLYNNAAATTTSSASTVAAEQRRLISALETRHVTMFATLDGSLGYLMPIPEKTYRRLLMLQNVLNNHIPHAAGLNPKGFRMYRVAQKSLTNPQKNIIDGDLVYRYQNLSHIERNEVARKIGTSQSVIMDDLIEMENYTCHF